MKTFFIIIVVLLCIWIIWSLFADKNLESPTYTVLEKKNGYEIRAYDSYIVAETIVPQNTSKSTSNAFRELAGYIFGGNKGNENISMTVPVATTQEPININMTVPVATKNVGDMMTMSFMMPQKFTLENLPKPDSNNISFRQIPAGTFAVLSFTGLITNDKWSAKIQKLHELLITDGMSIVSDPELLQYDQPIKFPWLRTHEIKIEINPKTS